MGDRAGRPCAGRP